MLPEPPQPLPPIDLGLVPSAATRTPSINLACLLTESKPRARSLFSGEDTGGSCSPAVQTLILRPCQIHQTPPNSFGLFRVYNKESLPIYDPEDTIDDSTVPQPTTAWDFVAKLTVENPFYLYPNESSLLLGDWYWDQGSLKSKGSFKRLLDIIGSPSFQPNDIRNTKWTSIDRVLGALATDDDQCSPEWLHNDAGWKHVTVTISVPIPRRSANPGPTSYDTSDFYCHSLLSIIHEQVLDPSDHHLFRYEPYELRWRHSNCDIKVHGELYTLKVFLDAHRELLESPPEPGCTIPRHIIALMFWSDAMQLTSFGDAKLWLLYVFFGNQTKYRRGQPSAKLCSHVAYFQMVSMVLYFQGLNFG